MLPPEILDQITSLNSQYRELLSVIHRLTRTNEITSQVDLSELSDKIKNSFADADRGIEVFHLRIRLM